MNVTFTPDQFSQLLDLILTTNFLSFFAAIVAYDFLKVLISRFLSIPISRYPAIFRPRIDYFGLHVFIRKSYKRLNFENYYKHVKLFIHKNC